MVMMEVGSQSMTFILDTGAEHTMVSTPYLISVAPLTG